jgi:hypothetical protein
VSQPVAARGRCLAFSRLAGLEALADGTALCVDTFRRASQDMRRFSPLCPFTTWDGNPLPVPGLRGHRASSVEGVWQGLKLVDGVTDLGQLTTVPHKRPPDHLRTGSYDYRASTFRYGNQEVGLLTARLVIYLPAFLFLLDRVIPMTIHDELHAALGSGRSVAFYDWDGNMDIDNDLSSFSHSSILAAWFSGSLEPLVERWRNLEAELTGRRPPVTLHRYRPEAGGR